MIDLHTHVLPGLDNDGPKTWEDSIAIGQAAYQQGTTCFIATPHQRDVMERSSTDAVRVILAKYQQVLKEKSILVDVVLGMENRLDLGLPQEVEQGRALPINGHQYILVELPHLFYPQYTEEVLFQIQLKGFIPVIAHPERNSRIQERLDLIERLVQRGILSQITAGSLQGLFGSQAKKTALKLLQLGMVHVIASDTHTPGGERSPNLLPGLEAASRVVGRSVAKAMVWEVPQAILEGREVDSDWVRPQKRPGWWIFRRG